MKKPTSIQRREPRVAAPASEHEAPSAPSVAEVDRPAEAPVLVGVDEQRRDEDTPPTTAYSACRETAELAGVVHA